MEIIKSLDNNFVKKLGKLYDKKYREEFGEYIVEGLKWAQDIMKEDNLKDLLLNIVIQNSRYEQLAPLLKTVSQKIVVLDDKVFDKVKQTENSQGIISVLKIALQKSALSSDFILYLDRIRDPGNMGAIIRSAAATGFNNIICNDCVDVYNPKVIRSCMTGILFVDIFDKYSIDELQNLGYNVIVADMRGESIFGFTKSGRKTCLVIGNEANGVSEQIISASNQMVSLPMEKVESLNAAVSATTLMYQLKFN